MGDSIGPKIELEGESEYKKAISGITTDMKVLGSEMKKVSAEFADNGDSIEALTKKDEVLNKQLETQAEKVDTLRKALENSQSMYGESDTKTKNWQKTLNLAEADLFKLNKEVKDNKEAMEKAKNPTEDMAREVKDFGENADKAGKHAFTMGDMIKANLISDAIVGGVKALGSSMLSIASGVGDAINKTLDYSGTIADMAASTGVGAEELQKYKYAAEMSGLSVEQLEKSMVKSQKSFADAKEGSKGLQEAYQRLGIDIDTIGNSEDAFDATLSALADMEDETTRNALANDIFGKSYADMAPLLNEGSAGIDALKTKAEELGIVMSEDAVNSGEALGDTLDTLKTTAGGVANSFVSLLLPGLAELAEGATTYMSDFSGAIQGANGDVGQIGEIIGTTLSDLVGKIVEKLPEIIEGAKSLITSFAEGINEQLPTIIEMGTTIVMDLVQGLIASLPDIIQSGLDVIVSLAKGIADSLPELIPTIVDTIMAIVETLIDNVDELIDAALEIIMALADGLIEALPELIEKIPIIIEKLINALAENGPKLIEAGITLVVKLAAGLIKAIPDLLKSIPKIITSVVKGFAEYYSNLFKIGGELVDKLWNGMEKLVGWIGTKTSGLGKGIVKSLSGGITGLASIGGDLVRGLWNGIGNMASWIKSKIQGFGKGVLDNLKDFFGIHSPSTKFRDEIGKNLALGLGEGFTDEMDGIAKDMNNSVPTDFEVDGIYNMTTNSSANGVSGGGFDMTAIASLFANMFGNMKLSANVEVPTIIGTQEFGRAVIKCTAEYDRLNNPTPQFA